MTDAYVIDGGDVTGGHIRSLAAELRPADWREMQKLGFRDPIEGLLDALHRSLRAWCCIKGERVLAMWGVVVECPVTGQGMPWCWTGQAVEGERKLFLRMSRAGLEMLLQLTPHLRIMVDAEYAGALRWMRWLGFEVSPPMRWVGGELFCEATIKGGV